MSTEFYVEGEPTSNGTKRFLFYNEKNDIVSLTLNSAKKRGCVPVTPIEWEKLNNKNTNKEIKKEIIEKKELNKPNFYEIVSNLIKYKILFQIYKNGELIFDFNNETSNMISINKDYFETYGKKYFWNQGLRIKKI